MKEACEVWGMIDRGWRKDVGLVCGGITESQGQKERGKSGCRVNCHGHSVV